ncbi:hypothetical protein TWF694_002995 [Orbilia ellipsospora]|uniref:F-box domain-containing protein n=1 Tax=Orbilia ellipsospora TaxID=2528407 RepID=A0AAV9X1P0_9PEZI
MRWNVKMAKITDLPTELLLDIFQRVDNASVARCRRVCHSFLAVANQIHLTSYTLLIDHQNFSAWKFFRSLLNNHKLGDHLTELKVEWYRRTEEPETWTPKWIWSEEDLVLINKLQKIEQTSTIKPETFDVIKYGGNSEALLPVILCFTNELKSLDMGKVQLQPLVIDYYSNGNRYTPYLPFLGIADPPDPDPKEVEDEDSLEAFEEVLIPPHVPGDSSVLWFHANIGHPGKYLPGLKNLTSLSHGYDDTTFTSEYLWGWYAKYLAALLFLPKIERISVAGCATLGMGTHDAIHNDIKKIKSRGKSTVRELAFWDARMNAEDYVAIAEVTERVTRVSIESNSNFVDLEERPDIVYHLRKYNKALEAKDIIIQGDNGENIGENKCSYYDQPDGSDEDEDENSQSEDGEGEPV